VAVLLGARVLPSAEAGCLKAEARLVSYPAQRCILAQTGAAPVSRRRQITIGRMWGPSGLGRRLCVGRLLFGRLDVGLGSHPQIRL
jgi:hypothetical protein